MPTTPIPRKKNINSNQNHNHDNSTDSEVSPEQTDSSYITHWGFKVVLMAFMVFMLLLVVLYQTLFARMEQSQTLIEIGEGDSYYELIETWDKEMPFFSSTMAKIHVKLFSSNSLHMGTYEIPKNPNFLELKQILENGSKSALIRVQIIEGKRASDLYNTLRKTNGVKVTILDLPPQKLKDALNVKHYMPNVPQILKHNMEGWFAPNTYLYAEGTTDKKILEDLYKKQQKILDAAWKNRAPGLPYKNKYEALIMASIIEKETGLRKERARVAGVFVNRLRKGMRLQTDPTIIYGMGDRYEGNIRKKDIAEKTLYNTYQIHGLPPTPIALPSMPAINATLHPEDTKDLFFVATGYGGHKFSETYAQHKTAVDEYLKVIRSKQNN